MKTSLFRWDDRGVDEVDAQASPVEVTVGQQKAVLKVEGIARVGKRLLIAGWAVGPLQLKVVEGKRTLEFREVRFLRSDVAEHFGRPPEEEHGFVLVVERAPASRVRLSWRLGATGAWSGMSIDPETAERPAADVFGPAAALLAQQHEPFSPEWLRLVALAPTAHRPCATAHGFLEVAASVEREGSFVVAGWAVSEVDDVFWIEDDTGDAYPLTKAVWRTRHDVYTAIGPHVGPAAARAGFVLSGQARATPRRLRLKVLAPDGVHLIAEIGCNPLPPDAVAVARWLFGIPVGDAGHDTWYHRVSGPLLGSLITRAQSRWDELPVRVRAHGGQLEAPTASLIIPLHGRYDFVESQMVEWARDAWLRRECEIIYVVDDPALVESFGTHAQELHRLYGVPFRWVWGGANRGFSGANNLGAAHARGNFLVFLNSDVFPHGPGWLETLIAALRDNTELGVVAPRLLFADGGIQHAGMRFEELPEYGVWINRHPYMGLDPALDPAKGLTLVPAVTGACMVMRRADFEEVGGWDTGYLVGDFEDSDLCLKLRRIGKRCAYLPDVQLTHLERQSMVALGTGEFRTQVTLWNALRHQTRWRESIEEIAQGEYA